jgi:hypothetical protein
VSTVPQIGLVAGIIVDHLGYHAAFLAARGVALVALTLLNQDRYTAVMRGRSP